MNAPSHLGEAALREAQHLLGDLGALHVAHYLEEVHVVDAGLEEQRVDREHHAAAAVAAAVLRLALLLGLRSRRLRRLRLRHFAADEVDEAAEDAQDLLHVEGVLPAQSRAVALPVKRHLAQRARHLVRLGYGTVRKGKDG